MAEKVEGFIERAALTEGIRHRVENQRRIVVVGDPGSVRTVQVDENPWVILTALLKAPNSPPA